MEKNSKYGVLVFIITILLYSFYPVNGEGTKMDNTDITIHNLSIKDGFVLDPFKELEFSFEIMNPTDKSAIIDTRDSVIISLIQAKVTCYKRSLEIPVTSKELLEAMREKRRVNAPEPFSIEPQKSRVFTFNSFNTMPMITGDKVDLLITAKLNDGREITSNPVMIAIKQFKVIESTKTVIHETENVNIVLYTIEVDKQRKIAVYYSQYPIFDYRHSYNRSSGKYPNYESFYALLPCKNGVKRAIPVITHEFYTYEMFLAQIFGDKLEIIPVDGHYKPLVSVKFNKSDCVEKIMRFFNKDKLCFLLLAGEKEQKNMYLLKKGMVGWEISNVKHEIDLNTTPFEKLNPLDILK